MSKPEQLDEVGTFVVDSKGRAGIIVAVYSRICRVRFGVDGPFAVIPKKTLRVATDQEIDAAGLGGEIS